MTWFRVDDGFADHPKTLGVSLAAIGLWAKAGAWCSKHLTNGEIPAAAIPALGGSPKLARELVAHGLWSMRDTGYAFHQWDDHQPTRDEVLAKRAATRDRVTRHRTKPKAPDVPPGNALRNGVTNADGNATPVPTRPDPSRPSAYADAARVLELVDQLAQSMELPDAGALSQPQRNRLEALAPAMTAEASRRGASAGPMLAAAWRRFTADPKIRAGRLARPDVFLGQWQQWLAEPDAKPQASVVQLEWEAACKAGDEALARFPGKTWEDPELQPFKTRLAAAKRALDAEREQRQALS